MKPPQSSPTRRTSQPRRADRRAFTLAESIAAITTLAVVGGISSSLLWTSLDAYANASIALQQQDDASAALDFMVIQLRGIPKVSGRMAPDIAAMTSTSITWSTNSSFTLTGATLMFTDAGAPAIIVADNVCALEFHAFDENNKELDLPLANGDPDKVRRISVALTVGGGGRSQMLRTRVFLRSLMSGS